MTLVIGSLSLSCMAEWLARVAPGEYVHGFDGRPVHGRDVSKIGDAGMVGSQHRAGVLVDLRIPSDFAAEDRLDGHIEPAVTREQGADSGQIGHPPTRRKILGRWA